ncbi:MFS transporter [Candidatus Fukatsuia anoeciicola]|uniref:MFS transporter n=1 Tax=Candidatus Fukatsuia anoeciicola TaxID=2994492 RepID=UPI003463B06A
MNDNKMTSLELRAAWGLGIIFSLRMLGMFMVLPVITTYGMALNGANEVLIGIAIGIYGFTQVIFQIPFGFISDRIGHKPLIIFGLIVFMFGSIVAALSNSIWGIILGRALQGSGVIAAAVMALLSDLTREQNRTKAMALIGISFGITFAIAMFLGPMITHSFGLNILFGNIAILALLSIIIAITIVPTTNTHILNREASIVKSSITKVFNNYRLLKINFGIMCLHILLMSNFIALPHVIESAKLSPKQHGYIYLITMLISFAMVVPFIIYAETKRHIRQVFISCVAVLCIAEIILCNARQHLWIIIIGMQLFFIVFNLMEAILPSLISKESPASYKGTAMSIYSTSQFIGTAIGGSLGGWIFGVAGAEAVFINNAIIALLWFAISCTMQEPPYVSSLRIVLSAAAIKDVNLEKYFRNQLGVTDVVVVREEQSIYVKVDTKQTTRHQLEQLANKFTTKLQ